CRLGCRARRRRGCRDADTRRPGSQNGCSKTHYVPFWCGSGSRLEPLEGTQGNDSAIACLIRERAFPMRNRALKGDRVSSRAGRTITEFSTDYGLRAVFALLQAAEENRGR